jgi:hypothetical protein
LTIVLGYNSNLSLVGVSLSRLPTSSAFSLPATAGASAAALDISGGPGIVRLRETSISDDFEGPLISVMGDRNEVFLDQVSLQSAQLLPVGPVIDTFTGRVPTICLLLTGDGIHAEVRRTRLHWCGAGGVALTGSDGRLHVEDSEFYGGHSGGGGGLLASGPRHNVTMLRSWLRGHWADDIGGAVLMDGDDGVLTLDSCTVEGNQAGAGGAGIALSGARGRLALRDCNITYNVVYFGDGGGVMLDGPNGTVELSRSSFVGNQAGGGEGGGVAIRGAAASVSLCHFRRNQAGGGGGIRIAAPLAAVISSIFVGNQARGGGGGGLQYRHTTDKDASFEVSGSRFLANMATSGGSMWIQTAGAAALRATAIADNTALGTAGGGGLWFSGVVSAAAAGVHGDLSGGGGALNVSRCEVIANRASRGGGGGIVVSGGSLTVDSSRIASNHAGGDGGGVSIAGYPLPRAAGAGGDGGPARFGTWSIASSEISRNTARGAGGGVAVHTKACGVREIATGDGMPIAIWPVTVTAEETDDSHRQVHNKTS